MSSGAWDPTLLSPVAGRPRLAVPITGNNLPARRPSARALLLHQSRPPPKEPSFSVLSVQALLQPRLRSRLGVRGYLQSPHCFFPSQLLRKAEVLGVGFSWRGKTTSWREQPRVCFPLVLKAGFWAVVFLFLNMYINTRACCFFADEKEQTP